MISKPEWLRGEVKSFENIKIDYDEIIEINFSPDENSNVAYALAELLKRLVDYNKIKNFLTQPFTPDLIIGLFEGSGDERNLYIKGHHILIYPLSNCMVIGDYKFPIPKTLNQFIAYCNAVNIPLIWKSGE